MLVKTKTNCKVSLTTMKIIDEGFFECLQIYPSFLGDTYILLYQIGLMSIIGAH